MTVGGRKRTADELDVDFDGLGGAGGGNGARGVDDLLGDRGLDDLIGAGFPPGMSPAS